MCVWSSVHKEALEARHRTWTLDGEKLLGVFDLVDEEALQACLCTKTLDDECVLSSENETLELCNSTKIEDDSYITGWLVPGDKETLENVTC